MMESVQDRFLRYVKFDTRSEDESETCPSTANQLVFGKTLVEELLALGLSDACMDADGYIYATVPGDPTLPVIGLIAHMDTSPETSGTDVKARIVTYSGGDVELSEGVFLREQDYPSLKEHRGKRLIVTDGTTLLGADDKAGIAEIVTLAQELLESDRPHATVRIAITPDEEIGRGADRFDVAKFGADFAYTVDGGGLGEIEFENFNAAGATVVAHGINIHPGSAKDKMVNSQLIAMEFQSLLPIHQRPECTEGYEGFFHLIGMEGCVEQTTLRYIVRDHDMERFLQKKEIMEKITCFLNEKYGFGVVELKLTDSYFNMREQIEPCMYIVERAKTAMIAEGIQPLTTPIRGGTDGARLSFMGLPCPNLFTGGHNFHGRFEYIPVEDMEACVRVLHRVVTM